MAPPLGSPAKANHNNDIFFNWTENYEHGTQLYCIVFTTALLESPEFKYKMSYQEIITSILWNQPIFISKLASLMNTSQF